VQENIFVNIHLFFIIIKIPQTFTVTIRKKWYSSICLSVFVIYFYYIKCFQILYSTSYKLNVGIDIFIWDLKMICIHFLVLMLKFAIFKNCILDEIFFWGLIYPTFTLQTPTYSNNNSKCHILKSWTIKKFRELWN
jgi:hypothetical protein